MNQNLKAHGKAIQESVKNISEAAKRDPVLKSCSPEMMKLRYGVIAMSNDKLFCKYTPNEKNQESHSKLLGRVFCVDKEDDGETYSLTDYCERNDTQVKSIKSLAFHQNFSFVTKAEADQYLEDKNAFVDRELEFITKELSNSVIGGAL